MPSKKKNRLCPFSSATARRKKPKKSFSSDWAENLSQSGKGSYFDQERSPMTEGVEWAAKRRMRPVVQANQKLRLKNLFRSNLRSKNGLGSTWMFQCQNEICQSSHEMNLVFPTTEKSSAFAINRASDLGFQAIAGGGHPAASTVFSFLVLWPINKNSWAEQIYIRLENTVY